MILNDIKLTLYIVFSLKQKRMFGKRKSSTNGVRFDVESQMPVPTEEPQYRQILHNGLWGFCILQLFILLLMCYAYVYVYVLHVMFLIIHNYFS